MVGREVGDMIVVVEEIPHETFRRQGPDLFLNKEITLQEALVGVDFAIRFLDGSRLRVKNLPGDVIKPDQIKTIKNKGLPYYKDERFGNLFIAFKVRFPDKLDAEQIAGINIGLNHMLGQQITGKTDEICQLEEYNEG